MSWRRFRRVLLLGLVAALACKAIRSLRGPEAPAFTRHPSAWDGQVHQPAGRDADATPVAREPGPTPAPAPVAQEPAAGSTTAHAPAAATRTTWAEPVDGSCPPGYPIKAKERSGIYHEPGMLAYDRTIPDRCYASGADARADGFRAAKR